MSYELHVEDDRAHDDDGKEIGDPVRGLAGLEAAAHNERDWEAARVHAEDFVDELDEQHDNVDYKDEGGEEQPKPAAAAASKSKGSASSSRPADHKTMSSTSRKMRASERYQDDEEAVRKNSIIAPLKANLHRSGGSEERKEKIRDQLRYHGEEVDE